MKPVQRCVYNFVQYQLYRYVLSNTKTIEEVVKKLVHFSLSILRLQSIFWFKSKQQRKWNKMKCSKKDNCIKNEKPKEMPLIFEF